MGRRGKASPPESAVSVPPTQAAAPQQFLVLRVSSIGRWKNPENGAKLPLDEALSQFRLRPNEEGLSFYCVGSEDEIPRLAVLWSLTLRDSPGHFDYVQIPIGDLSPFQLEPRPVVDHHTYLSERHYELTRPTEEDCQRVAMAFHGSPNQKVERLAQGRIVELAIAQNLDSSVETSPNWMKLLKRQRDKRSQTSGSG